MEDGGAIIAERTPEAFADAIESLSSDRDRLNDLGLQGREHILRWLDTDSVAEQYEAMYESATTGRSS